MMSIPPSLGLKDPSLLRSAAKIGDQWITAETTYAVINPATGVELTQVPSLGASATEAAIQAAQAALEPWKQRTAKERADLLKRWFALLIEHQEDLARIMTLEQGKPLKEARGEVSYAASFIEWFAEQAKRVQGEVLPGPQADKRLMVLKQPVGVVAAITPWNFPAAMITRKAAPALAAGCTLVIKPASQTPLTALALMELADRAGFPPGVMNVITADSEAAKEVGTTLCASPLVRKLSFTGSTAVGIQLMAQCAPTLKKMSLELGGNAPFIVFNDADLDAAVEGALIAKYRNAGQTCVCANRFYIQSGVYEAFAEKFAAAVAQLKVGDGLDPDTDLGPLINQQAVDKVNDHLEDALAQGAQIYNTPASCRAPFMAPVILTEAQSTMRVAREETFGPLAPLFRFDDEAEVIALANATEFGLAAYFYARDLSRVWRVAEALEYGMVGINTGLISNEVAPFGGIKSSGLGREGSTHGIDEYLEMKYLCLSI